MAEIQGKQLLDGQWLREERGSPDQIDVVGQVHLFYSSHPAQQSHCKGVGNMMEIRGMGGPGEKAGGGGVAFRLSAHALGNEATLGSLLAYLGVVLVNCSGLGRLGKRLPRSEIK